MTHKFSSSSSSSSNSSHGKRRRRSMRRAFSLIEVIIAVTIMAIMAAVFVPRLGKWIGTAKSGRAKTEAASLASQVRLYMTESGMSRCPEGFELEILTEGDDPYLDNKKSLLDPWNHAYVLIAPGEFNKDFDIVSYGADGQPGGDGDNKDIVNGQD